MTAPRSPSNKLITMGSDPIVISFFVLVLIAGSAQTHQLQTTLTDIHWFPDRGMLEVTHSIHLDDVMVLLADLGDPAGRFDLETEAKLLLYVEDHFRLSTKGQVVTLEALGAQIDGDYLWIYQETAMPDPPEGLSVNMSVLQAYYPDERHHVNLIVGSDVKNLVLDAERNTGHF